MWRREALDERLDPLKPAGRRLQSQAANAEITGHHALAGDDLENLHDLFALAEAIEEDGHGAEVDGVRAEPDQVRSDASEFGEEHANVLGALGNFDAESFSTARQ